MARKNRYPRIQIRQLPILEEGGGIGTLTPIGMSSTYMPKAPTTMAKVDNPALSSSSNYGGLVNAGLGALSSGLSSYGQTGSIGSGVSSLVDTAVKSIPIAGQIISAVDMIADPIASAIGDNSPTDPHAQAAERLINPLNSLESGISNLIDGNSSEGWNDLAGVVLPGFAGYNDAMKAKRDREDISRRDRIRFDAQHKQQEIKEGYGWRYGDQLPKAEDGGYLQPNMQDQISKAPQITSYGTGGTHATNPNGGIPVDAQGSPSIVSGRYPVATTEESEISWWNPRTKSAFIFSNKVFRE